MAKSQILGNGKILVGLDKYGQVYDFYFPYIGLENHTSGKYVHKIGIWVDGVFSWVDDGNWEVSFEFEKPHGTAYTRNLTNQNLGLRLIFDDAVYNEKNILLRRIKVENINENPKVVKLYLNQQFEIYESYRGDTAFYHPGKHAIFHYKGRRIFFIKAKNITTGEDFQEYSIGLNGIEGKEGTFKDAEDGKLEGNPIEHGLTDSVIGFNINLAGNSSVEVDYWVTVAKLLDEVFDLNDYVEEKTLQYLHESTKNYWKAWATKTEYDFKDLDASAIDLFYSSLMIMRFQTDNEGAVVASTDTDLLKYGRDAYSYVWPRDSAFTSIAYSRSGYEDINEEIFNFFLKTITRDGYFMHKYRSDASLGSSWHPWIYKGIEELPIQIDETALVIVALWEYFKTSKNIEYLERVYNDLVRSPMNFLTTRINKDTGVVSPSYDLWEERFGTATFTSCTVYGACIAAANLAEVFGKDNRVDEYKALAEKVKEGILNNMYDASQNYFYKTMLMHSDSSDGEIKIHHAIDASTLYGLFKFKVLDVHDHRLQGMKQAVLDKLACKTGKGGIPRYEGDRYFKVGEEIPGNPWIITTLWVAQLEIAEAKSIDELQEAKDKISWAINCASSTGILPEQINPYTGEALSASPLTWSHAEYVVTVLDYIEKYAELVGTKDKLVTTL